MIKEGRSRVIIEGVGPEIDCGLHPIKRIIGETVEVRADIFGDGHDEVAAALLFRPQDKKEWQRVRMHPRGNDRWEAVFPVQQMGFYLYTVQAWVDHFLTWQKAFQKKYDAGQDIKVELQVAAGLLADSAGRASGADKEQLLKWSKELQEPEDVDAAASLALESRVLATAERYPDLSIATCYSKELKVWVDRERALFSSWYEFFPRSAAGGKKHGTFKDCENLLPSIAGMGFDVVYFPPIHPIGKVNRKGKNNAVTARPDDVGSPWAIGSDEGGHTAIHPELGTMEDFRQLVKTAEKLGLEIALDLAYQCAPDHPFVKEHPEWFKWRPDGTVQYAENPPKKYQDVLPVNFETENWKELWEALKDVVTFWIDKGVKIFRVDNPHTKPFPFWEWLISEIRNLHPEIIFLAEAFTRPKVMYKLAKVGFSQSYTYFTWRHTKWEFRDYLQELTRTEVREYFRPNFWPNTPDILPEHLQIGGKSAFEARLVLAGTLSSNYGVYGPAFDLLVNQGITGKEEYIYSEKYEVKDWQVDKPGNLQRLMTRFNQIRRENPALQTTWNIEFLETQDKYLLYFMKTTEDLSNILLVVVNMDPFYTHAENLRIPLEKLKMSADQSFLVQELLSERQSIWQGARNYVELNPEHSPAAIFRVDRRVRRENDFDYYL
ncbi:MAG: alpha-1,4-glucan--maltose-1-phosphate maltosyltransferase [Calditrichia bacterium]